MKTMKQDRKNRAEAARRFDKWFEETERKHAEAIADRVAEIEIAKAYFSNPSFRKYLEDSTWAINNAK